MKRFYSEVTVDDGQILLDGRAVRTPLRAPLILPNLALAQAVAGEWRAQGETIAPDTMPFTGLANAAIDRVAADPAGFARSLAAYAETDLLCYRAAEPPALVDRQHEEWDPLLAWARQRYDVAFTLVTGIMHRPQPAATVTRLGEAVAAHAPFALAALLPLVTISGSLIVALAVAQGAIGDDAAFDAAHLDELWQAELWGEDELAVTARASRRAAFRAAARFLALLDTPRAGAA